MPQAQSFTLTGVSRLTQLKTDVYVQSSYDDHGAESGIIPPEKAWNAIWDTGATSSCISQRIVKALNLTPHGATRMSTPNGCTDANTYLVDFFLPNRLIVPKVQVLEAKIDGDNFDILIGMDIIGLGDFTVTHHEGKTCFSFRIPSLQKIDFTQYVYSPHAVNQFMAGRNDLCPCGSGQKFKRCHGKTQQ